MLIVLIHPYMSFNYSMKNVFNISYSYHNISNHFTKMWMALICLWKRHYLPLCSSLSFTQSFILMQFSWISVRQIRKICSFHFIAKIQTILLPHCYSLHILNNLNLDLSWSNFVLSNLIKKTSQLVQNPTIWLSVPYIKSPVSAALFEDE